MRATKIKSKPKIALLNRSRRLSKMSVALFALVIILGGYALLLHSFASTCTVSSSLVNSCRPWLGAASLGYTPSGGFKGEILAHESRIGRQLDIVHDYLVTKPLSADHIALAKRPNTILYVTFKPMANGQKWSTGNGSNSAINSNIDALATSIKSVGSTKVMLSVWHEPENDVTPGGDPACTSTNYKGSEGSVSDYVAMWHNVRNRFNALGVTNVVWVLNYMGYSAWNCIQPDLWPGNNYVDWIMYDPYGGQSGTFPAVVSSFYNYLTSHSDASHDYLSKPWGLGEWGMNTTSQSNIYSFYDSAKASLDNNSFPKLKAYIMWDVITPASGDYRTQYSKSGQFDQIEQNHYNAFAQDAAFKAATTQTPTPTSSVPPSSTTPYPSTVITATPTPTTSTKVTPSPVIGPTVSPSPVPIPINIPGAPLPVVTGVVSVVPAGSPTSNPVITVDGQSVPSSTSGVFDTASLPNGNHIIAVTAIDPVTGKTSTTQHTVVVQNSHSPLKAVQAALYLPFHGNILLINGFLIIGILIIIAGFGYAVRWALLHKRRA
jgi:hypothetical protein